MNSSPNDDASKRATRTPMQPADDASRPVFTTSFGRHVSCDDYALDGDVLSPEQVVFSSAIETHDDDAIDGQDDDDRFGLGGSSGMHFRDVAPMQFASNFDAFLETASPAAFDSDRKAPVFVLDHVKTTEFDATSKLAFVTSPLSPSSYSAKIEVPLKSRCDFFAVNPSFTSHDAPTKIVSTVKTALDLFQCEYDVEKEWSIHATCILVAEEIGFSVNLFQLCGTSDKYEIEFIYNRGDQMMFAELVESIRANCADIDDDACLGLLGSKTLDAWMDASQELTGRRFAIKEKEASTLIQEINCDYMHVDTLYEVAKSIKNHCRHKGNRHLFLQTDRVNFLKSLKWMLSDSEELARFGLFVLLQFSKDEDVCSSFFSTPFEKSSFALSLDTLEMREQGSCRGQSSKFTQSMIADVRQSALFA
ncbi:hypothetical protein PINS_up002740 [Pythium insidiosum]|nr:hypothetical protein PINS_up002740 [Pythium insidiosum]